jgi:hypothetical protein
MALFENMSCLERETTVTYCKFLLIKFVGLSVCDKLGRSDFRHFFLSRAVDFFAFFNRLSQFGGNLRE